MIEVFDTADVSTSSIDFQADGSAAPGTTGRLADAGHVHPSSSPAYEVVSSEVISSYYDGVTYRVPGNAGSVSAPAGYRVVGGGFSLGPSAASNILDLTTYPSTDGSAWNVMASAFGSYVNSTQVVGTVYAICLAV
jgi:hypothetical protein